MYSNSEYQLMDLGASLKEKLPLLPTCPAQAHINCLLMRIFTLKSSQWNSYKHVSAQLMLIL